MEIKEHDYGFNPFEGHPDKRTNVKGCSYFFIGNGFIQAAVQFNKSADGLTPLGLLIMDPTDLGHKSDAYSFDEKLGLEQTNINIAADGSTFSPTSKNLKVNWVKKSNIPAVSATWTADSLIINEKFYCHDRQSSALIRKVTIQNNAEITIKGSLLIDLKISDAEQFNKTPFVFEILPGKKNEFIFEYKIKNQLTHEISIQLLEQEPALLNCETYWDKINTADFHDSKLNHLFFSSRNQLTTAIAHNGKMDASTWQYNLEWVRDASFVAISCLMAGYFETAHAMLTRLIADFVDKDGSTVDSGRNRPLDEVELDQNGVLLHAIWTYWVWTGDSNIFKKNWEKIKLLAEFPLQDIFWDKETRMLKNCRELWERHHVFGVTNGYELAYQVFPVIGLEKAAAMAKEMGEEKLAERWQTASQEIKTALLFHPQFALVDDGHFIKRRKESGEIHLYFEPPDRSILNNGMPLKELDKNAIEPDTSETFAIIHEVIDPKGPLATKTLEHLEFLWNQTWEHGGYARYNVTSEADIGGPWPLGSALMARAYLENENNEKVQRILNWMVEISHHSGSYLEIDHFDFRPSPPMPPLGIISWAWSELVTLFVHHVLGVRPLKNKILIRPKLLSLTENIDAQIRIRNHFISLKIKKQAENKKPLAIINNDTKINFDRQITLPYIEADYFVDILV